MFEIRKINLGLFGFEAQTENTVLNTNTTGVANDGSVATGGLSEQMKLAYQRKMIDIAKPNLVYNQFGQKATLDKHSGYSAQWRKYSKFGAATTPLTEGVTPDGQKLNVSGVRALLRTYGAYVALSDYSDLTAIDNNIAGATELMAAQAGESLDTITRNVVCSGTNIQYGDGSKNADAALDADTDELTVDMILKAVRTLRRNSADKMNGEYIGIIHPDATFDLMNDPRWQSVKDYDSKDFYEGEIGKIGGVRFAESPNALIEANKGASGAAVYHTVVFGKNAYGTVDIEGGQLEHIFHGFGSAGVADPLNQRATVGWKATHAAAILSPEYLVDIHHTSTLNPSEGN